MKPTSKKAVPFKNALWIETFIIYCAREIPSGIQKMTLYSPRNEILIRGKKPFDLFGDTFFKKSVFASKTGMKLSIKAGRDLVSPRFRSLVALGILKHENRGKGQNDYWYSLTKNAKKTFFPPSSWTSGTEQEADSKSKLVRLEMARIMTQLGTFKHAMKMEQQLRRFLPKDEIKSISLEQKQKITRRQRRRITIGTKRIKEFEQAKNEIFNSPEHYNFLAIGNYKLGNREEALRLWKNALLIYQNSKDRRGEAVCKGNMGSYWRGTGDLAKARECFKEALEISQELDDKKGQILNLGNLALLTILSKDLNQGIRDVTEALTLSREIKDKELEVKELHNVGIILKEQGKLDLALAYFHEGIKLAEEGTDIYELAHLLIDSGTILQATGETDAALEEFKAASSLCRGLTSEKKEVDFRPLEALLMNGKGSAFQMRGYKKGALSCHKKSLALYQDIGSVYGESNALRKIGTVYLEHPWNLKKAQSFLEKSLEIDKKTNNKKGEVLDYLFLAEGNICSGKLEAATDYLLMASELCPSLDNEAMLALVLAMQWEVAIWNEDFLKAIDLLEESYAASSEHWFHQNEIFDRSNKVEYTRQRALVEKSLAQIEKDIGLDGKVLREIYLNKDSRILIDHARNVLRREIATSSTVSGD